MQEVGETRRPWIERGDRHIRCELADGTVVAIGTDSMRLTGCLPPQAGRWRRFARAFCLRMGWAEVNTGTDPAGQSSLLPGDIIAGTSVALRASLKNRIAKARVHLLEEGHDRRRLARELLHRWLGRTHTPGATPQDHLLLLTPQCLKELAAAPDRCLAQLHDLKERYPALLVIMFPAEGAVPRRISMPGLLKMVSAAAGSAAALDENGDINPQAVEEGEERNLWLGGPLQ